RHRGVRVFLQTRTVVADSHGVTLFSAAWRTYRGKATEHKSDARLISMEKKLGSGNRWIRVVAHFELRCSTTLDRFLDAQCPDVQQHEPAGGALWRISDSSCSHSLAPTGILANRYFCVSAPVGGMVWNAALA